MPAPRRCGGGAGGVTVTGIAARIHGAWTACPVARLPAVVPLAAACDRGSNAGSPGLAHVASSVGECGPAVHRQVPHYFG